MLQILNGLFFPSQLLKKPFQPLKIPLFVVLVQIPGVNPPFDGTSCSIPVKKGGERADSAVSPLTLASISFPQGNVTFSCSPPQLASCTFQSSGGSFLSLPSAAAAAAGAGGFAVRFQFRTWNADGLLLSVQLNPEPQRLELRISNSRLALTLQNSGRQKSEVSVGESAS